MSSNKSRPGLLFLPSADLFQRMEEEASVNDKISIVIERIRCRESLLETIQDLFRQNCCIERDLKEKLFQVHNVSISIVEAIIEIESASHQKREAIEVDDDVTFSWDGETYLLKMLNDGQFICQVPSVVKLLGVEAKTLFRNPFLLPVDIDEVLRYDPGASSIELANRMKEVAWEVDMNRIKRASRRILLEEHRGSLFHGNTVHVTRIDEGNVTDFIEIPVANVPETVWHDLDKSFERTFDEAVVVCCVRLLVDNECSNKVLGSHIPQRVVLCMNEMKPQDLAHRFELVKKAGKVTISKQLAIAIYSTMLKYVLKMDLFKRTAENHSISSLRKWLIMVMSTHDYLLGCDAVKEGSKEPQKVSKARFYPRDNVCEHSLNGEGDGELLEIGVNCSLGKRSTKDENIMSSDDRAFLRDKIPVPLCCAVKVTEGERALKVIEGTCDGCLSPGDRIRIGHPVLSRLYHIDKGFSQQCEEGEYIFIRETFDHTPVLTEEFIDLNEPIEVLHNPTLGSTTRSRNGISVKSLIESTKLSTQSQNTYDSMTAETIIDRKPLTFATIRIWKLVQSELDSRLQWRKEFDNGLVSWQQNLNIDESCNIPCNFLRVRVDMTSIEQDCRDSLYVLSNSVHQQRLQYFEKVSLNDIIRGTFSSVCNWHPLGSSIDIFKWAKLARRTKFLSKKVKNSNHKVDMAFLRHSEHRKLNLTQFKSILLDMATIRFPSPRYNINEALANMLWTTVAMLPPVNCMIWRKAQEMALCEEVYRVCAQTRIAARVRMLYCKITYRTVRYAAIRIEANARRFLAMQRKKRKLSLAKCAHLYRIRSLSCIICQKYWRGFKRKRYFQLYKMQRKHMLMEARATRLKKLQGKFRKKMQNVIYRKVFLVQSIPTVTWMVLRDRRRLQQGVELEIQVYCIQIRRTHYFILSEQDIRQCLEMVILQRGPLSWEEMLLPPIISQLTTRLSYQMKDGLPVVDFQKTGIIERGNMIENSIREMNGKQYILSIYRSDSNIVIRLYDSKQDKYLRFKLEMPLLRAWLHGHKHYTETGEIDFIRARELVQMKAKLESINDQCDDLEPERGNNFLKEESEEIPLLLDTSKLVAWLMERISIRHNSKTCEDAIILQFEKDEEKAQDICRKLQSVWRSKQGRKIAKEKVYAQYEKHFDRNSQTYFYVHVRTGEKQWKKPSVLAKEDNVDDPPNKWRNEEYLDPETNQTQIYYYNPFTGQTRWLSEEDAARIVQRKFRTRQTQYLLNSNLSFGKIIHAVRFSRDVEVKYQEEPTKLSNRVNYALLCNCLKFDLQMAKVLYKDAIKQSSCHPVIARVYGIFILATSEAPMVQTLEKACRLFKDAETADPGAKKFQSARENFFYWSVVLHPDNPFALLNYALLHQCILGEYYRAEKIYRRALAQDPTNQNVVSNYNLFLDQCYPGGYYAGNGVPDIVVKRSHVKEERPEWGEWKVMFDPLCTNSFETFWFNSIDSTSSFEEPEWTNAQETRIK